MKLAGMQATKFFAKPEAGLAGLLIYGADTMRIALRRQEVIKALIGPEGEAEMRLTRLQGAGLKSDPTAVLDGIKAQGFFPGPRVVFVEDVTELQAKPIIEALKEWLSGDATLLVTSNSLKASSKLRKAFESHQKAYAIGLYDDPPSRDEIEGILKDEGLSNIDIEARRDIDLLSRDLDPGDFRQTLHKVSLYKYQDTTPVTSADISACAPATIEADIDTIINATAEGRAKDIGPLMQRLSGQGIGPVPLCIGAMRHYRTLYSAACDPQGPSQGLARAKPPVFGPRRDRMARQASAWGGAKLEAAVKLITATDLSLRSSSKTPQEALVERMMIRLAMQAPR